MELRGGYVLKKGSRGKKEGYKSGEWGGRGRMRKSLVSGLGYVGS